MPMEQWPSRGEYRQMPGDDFLESRIPLGQEFTCTSRHARGPLHLATDQASPEEGSVEFDKEGVQIRVRVERLPLRVHRAHCGQGFAHYRSPLRRDWKQIYNTHFVPV